MAFQIKQLPESEVEISIEVPAEDFNNYYKEVFEEASKSVFIKGFRPGKAPQEILEKNIDHNAVLKEAAEKTIRETYFPVLLEKKIKAIGRPEIVITKIAKGDSFCFKVRTAVLPEIKLPDYKKIVAEMRNKEKVVGEISKEEMEKARQKKRMEILEAISGASEMKIPEILVKAEKEKMIGELMSSIENIGMKWLDYLGQIKKTEEDLKKEWQEDALRRVKYGLILRELAEKEDIQVGDEELEAGISEILKHSPGLDRDYLRSYAYGIIRNEKVFNFLENI